MIIDNKVSKVSNNPEIAKCGEPYRFTKDNQPKRRGRTIGGSASEWLKRMGESKKIEFSLRITDTNGKVKRVKGSLESKSTINQLIAASVIFKAIDGDERAINIFFDRTEGKPNQHINNEHIVTEQPLFKSFDNDNDDGNKEIA